MASSADVAEVPLVGGTVLGDLDGDVLGVSSVEGGSS